MLNRVSLPEPSAKLVLFTGHSNDVTDLSFSPDGRTLATCSYDESIILWDVATGTVRRKLFGGGDALNSIAFSPDGKLLAAAGLDGVMLWDPDTGALLRTIPDTCWPLTFLPDGRLLATGGWNHSQQMVIWDIEANKEVAVLADEQGQANRLCVSADGTLAASVHYDRIGVWDLSTGRQARSIIAPEDIMDSEHIGEFHAEQAALSSDGRLVAAACLHAIRIWDARTGNYIRTAHTGSYSSSVAFSPDGSVLASGLDDGRIVLLDTNSWAEVHTIEGAHRDWIGKLAYSTDGSFLASGGCDHAVRIWNPRTGELVHVMRGHEHPVTSVSFASDGKHLITGHGDGGVREWDAVNGRLTNRMEVTIDRRSDSLLSPDSRLRAVTNVNPHVNVAEAIHLYDATTGALLHTFSVKDSRGFPEYVIGMAFSPDSGAIAIGHMGFMVTLWNTRTGELIRRLWTSRDCVHALAFSPDGKTLAAGTAYDSMVELFSVTTGRKKRTLTGHTNSVESVSFSPDARRLATASADGSIKIWNPRTGKLIATFLMLPPQAEREPSEEWLVYTPEGYYECSPGAERFIRWMVGCDVLPVEVFEAEFHRADFLTRVLGGGCVRAPRRGSGQR